jgi:hypothetical protein
MGNTNGIDSDAERIQTAMLDDAKCMFLLQFSLWHISQGSVMPVVCEMIFSLMLKGCPQ